MNLVASIAGGTGSGLFLPTALYLKNLASNLGGAGLPLEFLLIQSSLTRWGQVSSGTCLLVNARQLEPS